MKRECDGMHGGCSYETGRLVRGESWHVLLLLLCDQALSLSSCMFLLSQCAL